MHLDQVADIFRFNMTALVVDGAKRRRAKVLNAATGRPSLPEPKEAA